MEWGAASSGRKAKVSERHDSEAVRRRQAGGEGEWNCSEAGQRVEWGAASSRRKVRVSARERTVSQVRERGGDRQAEGE